MSSCDEVITVVIEDAHIMYKVFEAIILDEEMKIDRILWRITLSS